MTLTRGQAVADVALMGGCFLVALLSARAMTNVTIRVLTYVTRWAVAFAVIHALAALLRENHLYLATRDTIASGIEAFVPAADLNRLWEAAEHGVTRLSGAASKAIAARLPDVHTEL